MFVGGRNKPGMAGRSKRPHKTPVLMMAEVRSRRIGRCRAVVVSRLDGTSLRTALQDNIEPGSTVRSDGLVVLGQSMTGFVHDRVSVRGSGHPGTRAVPRRVASAVTGQTLAGGHPAGRRRTGTSAGVLAPVRVPVQPPQVPSSRTAVLPAARTGRAHPTGRLPRHHGRMQQATQDRANAAARTTRTPSKPRPARRRTPMARCIPLKSPSPDGEVIHVNAGLAPAHRPKRAPQSTRRHSVDRPEAISRVGW